MLVDLFRPLPATGLAITAISLVAGGLVAASPAFAGSVGSYNIDCGSTPYSIDPITASVNDTVSITNTGSGACDVRLIGSVTTSGTDGAGALAAGATDTYTFIASGLNIVVVGDALYPTNTSTYGVAVLATVTDAPEVAETEAPTTYLQQVPLPKSGSCLDVEDADLAWGTDVTGGWSKAWGEWSNNWVCSRFLTDAGGTWHTTNS